MARAFKLQDPGEGIHEVEVLEVLVEPGQTVEDGDTAFVVESDKAAIELPVPYDGTIGEIKVQVGQTIRVGDVLLTVIEDGEAADAEPTAPVEAPPPQPAAPPDAHRPPPSAAGSAPIKAAPTARRLAKAKGLDLAAVTPTGARGHITRADVEAHGTAAPTAPGPVTIEPLKSIRRATARTMAKAWAEIPHVMLQDQLDLTELERLRRANAAAVKEAGGQLTLMPFALKALAATLRDHPRFNASIDMAAEEIRLHRDIAIGVALDSARGLIVPVLRDAVAKSVFELAVALRQLAEAARGGQVAPDMLQGATITFTNIGALGGTGFFPIINPPQVAIIGLGRGALQPVILGELDDDEVEIDARYLVPVSLSFDHRVNDGADAARFLADFKRRLSDPGWFALHG